MKPAPPVMTMAARLDSCPLRVLQRELQLFGERDHRGSGPLPGPFGLEPQIADPTAPRRDDTADRAEICPVRVLLIEPPDHFRRDAHEGAKRGGGPDRVLAAVPGPPEHQRDLLEVV